MLKALSLIILYVVLTASPLLVLVAFQQPAQGNFLYELSRCLALTGVSVLALQTVLIARIRWIERPFGMDVLSRFHRSMGIFVAALVLPHPFLLIGGAGPYTPVLTAVSVPWYVGLGRIVWVLLAFHIGLSLVWKRLGLTYERWRSVHVVVAPLVMLAAFVHSAWTGGDLSFAPLYGAWIVLLAVFFSAYIAHTVIKPCRRVYAVTEVIPESHNVWTVELAPADGKPVAPYCPGQFHFVTFQRKGFPTEEHHWTISSSPVEQWFISSTIKESGDFTATIGETRPGDTAIVQGPFGRFSYLFHPQDREFVFIAGGIGITPLMSMLRHMRDTGSRADVILVYANRSERDIVFLEELEQIEALGTPKLKVVHVLSEPDSQWTGKQGRVDGDLIAELTGGRLAGRSFYLCCPPPMTQKLIGNLLGLGVSYGQIRTEFFSL